jgi:endoglucanase
LIQTLWDLDDSPHEIYAVFTVQEELGTRGATTAAFGIAPDIGLAIDGTTTGDTPEAAPMAVSLGDGPAIKVKDLHAGPPRGQTVVGRNGPSPRYSIPT